MKSISDIEIYIPDYTKKILVSFSGGVESTLVLYAVCKKVKDLGLEANIDCIHGLDEKDVPFSMITVNPIKEKIEQHFKIKIGLHTYTYKGSENKKKSVNEITKFIKNEQYDVFFTGFSSNPSREIMKSLGGVRDVNTLRRERDLTILKNLSKTQEETIGSYKYSYQRPLMHLHKKQIAEYYESSELLTQLKMLTRSCDFMKDDQACKRCYSCKEKYWAFGFYDFGEQ